ncbi:unnamed protein product [marine sediment metagenome]|uniref:3D domain-containing protein n=1 Tax=marine sediment metagenome TaxID=412755 RepID=X0VCJ1_9ZZZZ
MDGKTMPNGYAHNGCVIVEDLGWGISGKHLDFFVQKESYFYSVNALLGGAQYVNVYSNSPKCN